MREKLIPALIFTVGLLGLIYFAVAVSRPSPPRFIRADDGTPCYTYRGTLDCNFARANRDTQFGEFPYAD